MDRTPPALEPTVRRIEGPAEDGFGTCPKGPSPRPRPTPLRGQRRAHRRPLEAPRIASLDGGIGVRRRDTPPVLVTGLRPGQREVDRPHDAMDTPPANRRAYSGGRGRVDGPTGRASPRAVLTVIGRAIEPTIGLGIVGGIDGVERFRRVTLPGPEWASCRRIKLRLGWPREIRGSADLTLSRPEPRGRREGVGVRRSSPKVAQVEVDRQPEPGVETIQLSPDSGASPISPPSRTVSAPASRTARQSRSTWPGVTKFRWRSVSQARRFIGPAPPPASRAPRAGTGRSPRRPGGPCRSSCPP